MKTNINNLIYFTAGLLIAGGALLLLRPEEPSINQSESAKSPPATPATAPAPLSKKTAAIAPQTTDPSPKPLSSPIPETTDPLESDASSTANEVKELTGLITRAFSGRASADEELELWERLRNSPELSRVIKEQEQQIPRDSTNVDGHLDLAQLYVGKLVSCPNGPEKGLWAQKAEGRWRRVVELDPQHWDAQHSIAFSLSQYPDFLNRTTEAIEEYEKLLVIQREKEPKPRFADSYLELYRLYQKKGDPATAVEVLDEGLNLFPENKHLIEQRASISKL